MRCAGSFLSVVVLTTAIGVAAFYIIWKYGEPDDGESLPSDNSTYLNDTCGKHEWMCKEDSSCISNRKRCDGLNDCPDGTDENWIECNNLGKMFWEFKRFRSCGSTKRDNPPNITENYVPPRGCRWNRENSTLVIYCYELDNNFVPWDGLILHLETLTLDNVFRLENLTTQLIPPKNNSINRLYVDNGHIENLGPKSLCHWKHLCHLGINNTFLQTIHAEAFCDMSNLVRLSLAHNKLTLQGYVFPDMSNLKDLRLHNNEIEVVSDDVFKKLNELISLKLNDNRIRIIEPRAFLYNHKLQELYLSSNLLKQLHTSVFSGQRKLYHLELEFNPLETIPEDALANLESLHSLHLDGIESSAINYDVLRKLSKLEFVYFKHFSYCRYVPQVSICLPSTDGMSSVKNLFASTALRVIVWVVAVLTIVGNSIVLITRCMASPGGRGKKLDVFINNLATADLLMGVYLVILAVKDLQYRNSFQENFYSWSTSLLCSGIGVMAMISSEVSLLILTLMSVDRYLVISDPFGSYKNLTVNLSRVSMIIIWVAVTGLAVAPAIEWQGKFSFYGSSGLCLPIHLDEPFAQGWQYTTFVILGLNSLCLVVVAISYTILYLVIRDTRAPIRRPTEDVEMCVRFFLMVFTDCMCWLPIIGLKIYALTGTNPIPKKVVAWVIIFVLPINSTINPYLYTLSTPETRGKLFRHIIPFHALQARVSRPGSLRQRLPPAATTTRRTNVVRNLFRRLTSSVSSIHFRLRQQMVGSGGPEVDGNVDGGGPVAMGMGPAVNGGGNMEDTWDVGGTTTHTNMSGASACEKMALNMRHKIIETKCKARLTRQDSSASSNL